MHAPSPPFITFLNRGFQPHAYQVQHRPVNDPFLKARHQFIMGNRVKVALQIRIIHRGPPFVQILANLIQRVMCGPLRTKPKRTIEKISLEYRFHYQQRRSLYHSVPYYRDSQRPLTSIRLRYVHPSHPARPVGLCPQRLQYLLEESIDPFLRRFDHLKGYSINPRRSMTTSCNTPRHFQHVEPKYQPVQRIKPKLRLLLRLQVKLLSQAREFLRQMYALYSKELRAFITPLLRSGTRVQSALLSSDSARLRQGLFAPSGFPDFSARIGLSDSRYRQLSRLLFPVSASVGIPCQCGSPRYHDHSFDARSPLSPRNVLRLLMLITSSQVVDLINSDRLITFALCNEADAGSGLSALGLASSRSQGIYSCSPPPFGGDRPAPHVRLPLHRRSSLHVKRAINMDRPFHLSRMASSTGAPKYTKNKIKIKEQNCA
jgi:hypothetical protein